MAHRGRRTASSLVFGSRIKRAISQCKRHNQAACGTTNESFYVESSLYFDFISRVGLISRRIMSGPIRNLPTEKIRSEMLDADDQRTNSTNV
ncbi:MAG: hypothetical protein RIS70_4169 [Planctomycetota bacterium]|jgi:hypothetical protein